MRILESFRIVWSVSGMSQNERCHSPITMNTNIRLSSNLLLEPRESVLNLLHLVILARFAIWSIPKQSFFDENFIEHVIATSRIDTQFIISIKLRPFQIVRRILVEIPLYCVSLRFIYVLTYARHYLFMMEID